MIAARRFAPASTILLGLLLTLVLVAAPPSFAQGQVRTGQGSGHFTSVEETSSRDAGRNRIAERVLEGRLTDGPLIGTVSQEVRGVIHPNGRVTFHGTFTFTGTLEGCGEGTLSGRLTGRGEAGEQPVTDATMALTGQSSATIAAVGQGTVHQDGSQLSYEIRYVCR